MFVQKSAIVWSFALIILSCSVDVDAAKTPRRSSNKNKTPNRANVALSYGGHNHANVHHQPVQQQHQQQVHHAPSYQQPSAPNAPPLPTNNNQQAVGWKVPSHTAEQPKAVTNTHSALPYPQNPPPYTPTNNGIAHPAAGPPPAYPANANTGYNAHYPAGNPPPYSQHPNPNANPPAYSQQPAAQYPHAHDAGAGAGYPQQTYANPIGGYQGAPPNYAHNVPQPSVTNNFYPANPQQSSGGGGGGGFLQTALAAGAGSLAGNALYGALKPESESKTIVIHENAAQPAAPAAPVAAPAAPAAPVAAPVAPVAPAVPVAPVAAPVDQPAAPVLPAESTTASSIPHAGDSSTVQPIQTDSRIGSNDGAVPLAPIVPLAPLPDQQTTLTNVPLATLPDASTASPVQQSVSPQNQTIAPSSSVPLAPMPTVEPSSQAQKGSANSFAIFNISMYTAISILIASIF